MAPGDDSLGEALEEVLTDSPGAAPEEQADAATLTPSDGSPQEAGSSDDELRSVLGQLDLGDDEPDSASNGDAPPGEPPDGEPEADGLDSVLSQLGFDDEPDEAAPDEAEPPADEAPAAGPADVDEVLAGTVDDVLSSLDEPRDQPPARQGNEPEPAQEPTQIGSEPDGFDERPVVPGGIEALLQELDDDPAAPAPQPQSTQPQVLHQPQPQDTPAATHRWAAVAGAIKNLNVLHLMLATNSAILVVLVVGQFNFFRYAGVVTKDMRNTVDKTIRAASQALASLDEKLSQPPRPDVPRDRRLYVETLRDADAAFERREVVQAANLYKKVLEAFPDFDRNDHARFRLGECYMRQDEPRWHDSLAQFLIVMQQFPTSAHVPLAHLRAAHCYSQIGSYSAARKVLLELLAEEDLYSPRDAAVVSEARYRLGQYYALEARVAKERELPYPRQEAP